MGIEPKRYFSQDAELRVIGSALMDPQAIAKLAHLRADDFYNMAHRNIWDAIVDLGEVADWGTVTSWLERRELLKDVKALTGDLGIYLMTEAMGSIPTALNIERYAADVIDLARRRELTAALSAAAEANEKGTPLLSIGGKLTQAIAKMEPVGKEPTLADTIAEYSAEREAERDGTKTMGIPSGIGDLDRLCNGWRAGNLMVVSGATGGGKTTLKINFAVAALKRKYKTMFLGMEMGESEIVGKFVACISGVATGHPDLRAMTPAKWDAEYEGINTLAGYPLIVRSVPGITLSGIAEMIHKENTKGQVGLVIVDYLQLMGTEGSNRNESRATQIGAITRGLKALAGQAKCAIILSSQLNRGTDGEPQLKDLKESSSIEQDANIVLMIHDPQDKANPASRTLFIRKNRNGPTGVVSLSARLDISRMVGAERESR